MSSIQNPQQIIRAGHGYLHADEWSDYAKAFRSAGVVIVKVEVGEHWDSSSAKPVETISSMISRASVLSETDYQKLDNFLASEVRKLSTKFERAIGLPSKKWPMF